MAKTNGYLQCVGEDVSYERDTITCGHCCRVVVVKPATVNTVYLLPQLDGTWKEEPGAGCRACMKAICLQCYDEGICLPIEKRLEIAEAAARGFK